MKIAVWTLLVVLGFALMASCEDDDNDLPQEKTINGTWNLVNVHGGFGSVNINYSKRDIKWIFNQADSTLSVQNNIGNDNAFVLHSGYYNFNLEPSGETQILFVDNDYRMIILSMDNNLILTENANDGFTAEFTR
ncbi:hypothetical protein SAMN05421636_104118 [Pricia antarctica]|uniref:Lipocalin-like domain-containing protein n=1 Tax=Pricia antarctica TaxID=641691 RepID=A0A1G7BE84_9FLAO|nr:hypothetical protein [Pricia antarctica]SDE25353.1 hypothetical protein SAMN05421636_104118 [Pricia antarctica]